MRDGYKIDYIVKKSDGTERIGHYITNDNLDRILKRFNVLYLTDLNGNVIIDNRKGVN